MTSLFYFASTDPDDYATVNFSISPTVSQPVQVRVSGIQYQANFSITTDDDYIEFAKGEEKTKIMFTETECGYYDINLLPYKLTELFKDVNVSLLSTGMLKFETDVYKSITDTSHRVKLLLGLYHEQLPITINGTFTTRSVPLTNFGNILYLLGNIPCVVGLNNTNTDLTLSPKERNKEDYRSVCYKSSDFIYPGIPVNSRTPGPTVISRSDGLTNLKFELVDFQLQKVILHSPLYITFEVFYNLQFMPMGNLPMTSTIMPIR